LKALSILFALVALPVTALLTHSGYIEYRYGIDQAITIAKINHLYGDLLDRVEEIYDLESIIEVQAAVAELESDVPNNLGILRLSQRDKGVSHLSYGSTYFYFSREHYPESYFYLNGRIRRVPGLIRGYVKNGSGKKTDAIRHHRIADINDEEFDIELVLDYQVLLELSRAL
jgi:hypothetical protein